MHITMINIMIFKIVWLKPHVTATDKPFTTIGKGYGK